MYGEWSLHPCKSQLLQQNWADKLIAQISVDNEIQTPLLMVP